MKKGKKVRVALLFGGKSAEHEVSLRSAKNVADAIDKKKFDVVLIGIDKTGKWLLPDTSQWLLNSGDPKLIALNKAGSSSAALVPQSEGKLSTIDFHTSPSPSPTLGEGSAIDVVFPILHGTFGEDGTVQGLLKLAGVPFVGAGVLGSAVGMDKDVMKRLLRDAGLPIGKFVTVHASDTVPTFKKAVATLGLPLFIKPANLGSSVGVAKVHNAKEYTAAVADAFRYDRKILLEEYIEGREIECSVLGNDEIVASVPGEIIPHHEFYSYDAKYIDDNGAAIEVPAKLPKATVKKVRELAVKVAKTLSCEGLGRVDFFLKKNGDVVVNEINTIPGFTSISMYPKLWEASGIPYGKLIEILLNLAIERFEKEKQLSTTHE